MKKHFLLACLLMAMGGVYPDVVNAQCGDNGDGTFSNPVFWADVPDPDVIRVGDDFYMVSTTMHLQNVHFTYTHITFPFISN
jgi:hypothetical protein